MSLKIATILSIGCLAAVPMLGSATDYRTVNQPRQECWNEQVAVQGRSGDYGGAVIGGLAGGLLGNTVGGGNGRTAATAIGAVTGAMVGDRNWGSSQGGYQTVQRCRTVMDQVRVPVQTYYAPQPVVVQQQYYVTPQPVYREDWRAEHFRREQWRHEQEERNEWRRHEWREHHRNHEDDD